jgi:hypothetical protein
MSIISTLKEVVFKETSDAGKVSIIMWNDEQQQYGTASILVPVAAYDRAPYRAALRAINIKIPYAKKVLAVKAMPGVVKYPTANYYLVRAEFVTNK